MGTQYNYFFSLDGKAKPWLGHFCKFLAMCCVNPCEKEAEEPRG